MASFTKWSQDATLQSLSHFTALISRWNTENREEMRAERATELEAMRATIREEMRAERATELEAMRATIREEMRAERATELEAMRAERAKELEAMRADVAALGGDVADLFKLIDEINERV